MCKILTEQHYRKVIPVLLNVVSINAQGIQGGGIFGTDNQRVGTCYEKSNQE